MKFKEANDYRLLEEHLLNGPEIALVTLLLKRYVGMDRDTSSETALAQYVFDNIEAQASTITSVCVMNGNRVPVQNLIGVISSALLNKSLEAGKVIATNQCVAEFIYASPEIFTIARTFTNKPLVISKLFNEDIAEKKMFQLPSFKGATKHHKALGSFKWSPTTIEAVEKLNNVPLVVLDFEEQTIPLEGTEDRSKYDVRLALRPLLAKTNQTMHFNWHMDYRGRMYSSGKVLAAL